MQAKLLLFVQFCGIHVKEVRINISRRGDTDLKLGSNYRAFTSYRQHLHCFERLQPQPSWPRNEDQGA